jgi:hypothetical protein
MVAIWMTRGGTRLSGGSEDEPHFYDEDREGEKVSTSLLERLRAKAPMNSKLDGRTRQRFTSLGLGGWPSNS